MQETIGIGMIICVFIMARPWLHREIQLYLKQRLRKKAKWRPPFMCRKFGHLWTETEHKINITIFTSSLEICDRCGGGRILQIGGYQKYAPLVVKQYLQEQKEEKIKAEAAQEGKVLDMRAKQNADPSLH